MPQQLRQQLQQRIQQMQQHYQQQWQQMTPQEQQQYQQQMEQHYQQNLQQMVQQYQQQYQQQQYQQQQYQQQQYQQQQYQQQQQQQNNDLFSNIARLANQASHSFNNNDSDSDSDISMYGEPEYCQNVEEFINECRDIDGRQTDTSQRCNAYNSSGIRCRARGVVPGLNYCRDHVRSRWGQGACLGLNRNGRPCGSWANYCGFCNDHSDQNPLVNDQGQFMGGSKCKIIGKKKNLKKEKKI